MSTKQETKQNVYFIGKDGKKTVFQREKFISFLKTCLKTNKELQSVAFDFDQILDLAICNFLTSQGKEAELQSNDLSIDSWYFFIFYLFFFSFFTILYVYLIK